jgi:Leucine-rich repeat (LRR) protein
MAYYIKRGNCFTVTDENSVDIRTELPPNNYIIKQDMLGNIFLEMVDRFSFSTKRYGDNEKNTDRILRTFMSRENSTGVLLAGEKGSGKSLLAKTISIQGYELNIPTIIINSAMTGDSFNAFIQSIDQPAIILFDEFEKVYDHDGQEAILTLLDGVFPTKKLFMLTTNNKWRIDTHMKNRPGRIFYMIEFNGLSREFIEEYCNDNLNDKSHIERICTLSSIFSAFNFDMLKALVEEMNRYNETPDESLKFLNCRPEFEDKQNYTMQVFKDNVPMQMLEDHERWNGNPLHTNAIEAYVVATNEAEDEKGDEPTIRSRSRYDCLVFKQAHLKQITNNGAYLFVNEKGFQLKLTRHQPETPNLYDLF